MLRDVGPEDEERRVGDEEVERDPGGEDPDPRVLREGLPAVAELAQEVRRARRPRPRRQRHRREEEGARPVGTRVEEERPARADRRHDRASGSGADGEGDVARDAHEAVRLLEVPRRHRLGNEARRGGRVEGGRRAAHGLERDQLPDACVPADEQRAHRRADAEVRGVRGDHHEAAREPVGDDAADEQRRDLRQRPRGEREPDVGGGAGQVEHAERDGDRREVRAEERDRARGEEEPEAPLAEGTASEPADHAASRRLSQ